MRVSSRQHQAAADRDAQRAITALLGDLAERIAGRLAAVAGADGTIDLARRDDVRAAVREMAEPLFVQRQPVTGEQLEAERDHLDGLIEQARRDLRQAPAEQAERVRGRLDALAERRTLLVTSGVMFVALRAGHPVTPYARIVMDGAESVTRATIARHAQDMRRMLAAERDLLAWLGTRPQTVPARYAFLTHQPITEWADVRGYTLSDRIWRTGEQTIARIDALLGDGIQRGRSAVAIARDLEPFLRATRRRVTTATPYGIIGSFDARRLARSEITRAASLSAYVAGVTNPFVVRADYNLSGSHDPHNCDGTCDAHYAEGQRNDGYAPDAVPLPMVDTHPQCMCYITHRTAEREQVIGQLREQFRADVAAGKREPPVTPLLQDLLVAVLMGWTVEQAA